MKYLSRNDLEAIGARVIAAYKKLPAISGQPLERVDIDYLCQALLGLRIDYARLSLEGEKIGLTSSCEVGVEVFSEDPACEEELYYMLDGKTILIEGDLIKEGANVGRRNYTLSHESCHHILKMLFPRDYGAQARGRSVHYCYRSNHRNGDWEEWQVETLAAIILLPPECVIRNMERFGIGTQMRLLNRVFAPADYSKFEDMASFMGVSKTAMSIRMTQLGLLKRNDLIITDDGQEDIPVGVDILGYCRKPQPEQALLREEAILAIRNAFWKLTYKEQDIISRHLGFYKVCFRPLPPNTFEELADLYQYSTADGVMRFYRRALKKLRALFEKEGW